MNGATVKTLILGVVSLSAASSAIIFSQCPPEADESVQASVSEAEKQSLSELIALRIVAKNRVTREVIAHRLSLVQAAALFGALNRLPPQAANLSMLDVHISPLSVPARTEEERLCRQVVEYVRWALVEDPESAANAVARLDAEFKAELGKQESIHLPDSTCFVPVQELLKHARAELTETQRGAHRVGNSSSARSRSAHGSRAASSDPTQSDGVIYESSRTRLTDITEPKEERPGAFRRRAGSGDSHLGARITAFRGLTLP